MKTCYVDMQTRSIADLCEFYGVGLTITRINVPIKSRGKGHGRALLKQILEDADREQVTLYLEIVPSDGLSFEQLEAWYMRHGFKRWEKIYRRLPRRNQMNFPPFHVTVNKEGLVSLWDTEDGAKRAAVVEGETYLRLELTDEQILLLLKAKVEAKEKEPFHPHVLKTKE